MKPHHPDFRFYGSATIGTKGQIVIPADARNELNFKEGEKVVVVKAPLGDGIMVIRAEKFEDMIVKMQTQLNNVVDSLNDTKDND
jgi:AbrB family looped-hinge helix DNA binding protein